MVSGELELESGDWRGIWNCWLVGKTFEVRNWDAPKAAWLESVAVFDGSIDGGRIWVNEFSCENCCCCC